MENENNVKNILLISAMLIIIVLGGWIIYDKMINNGKGEIAKNNEVNKEKINEVVSQNKNYEFHDVKIYDEKTNGNIVYGNNYDFTKTHYDPIYKDNYNKNYQKNDITLSGENGNDVRVYVENGILYYAAVNSNRGTTTATRIDKVGKVKRIILAISGYCDYGQQQIVILSEDGSIYVAYPYYSDAGPSLVTAENLKINKIDTNEKFDNIAFMHPDQWGGGCGFGVIVGKTASNELRYYKVDGTVYDNKYEKLLYVYGPLNTIYVHNNATISFNGDNKISYQAKPIYYNEVYSIGIEYSADNNSFKSYLIDRQGYLYSMSVKNEKLENITKSSKAVSKVGIEKKQISESEVKCNIMIIFEDGSYEKINDISSYDYDDKNPKK